jgi:membrane protein involved in colicin uptake
MRHFFKSVLQSCNQESGATVKDEHLDLFASRVADAVNTKEFADRARRRIGESSPSGFDLGAGETINILWSKTMSAFTDAMAAVVATIKASQTAVDPAHIASIDASIQSLTASESTDAANIADIQAGLQVLTDGLGGTSTGGSTGTSGGSTGSSASGSSSTGSGQ